MNYYPIGIPGQPWGSAERAQWLARTRRQRSYRDEVLDRVLALGDRFLVREYGQITSAGESFALLAVSNRDWRPDRPRVLVTGGVHGYETSGVLGALQWLEQHAGDWEGKLDWCVLPCISPWAYERVQRWNADAIDPNRSFHVGSKVAEAAAMMRFIDPWKNDLLLHIDLHETTDSDEGEFRPALAARDGKPFAPGHIPDGFYLVADSLDPQLDFQERVIEAVARVTHIAAADERGCIIGAEVLRPGVILYPFRALGLCAGSTGAVFTTTTEVYPDSPRTTPGQCNDAQAMAVQAAIAAALALAT